MAAIPTFRLLGEEARRVARLVTWLAAVLGTVVALAVPIGYCYVGYRYEAEALRGEADLRAARLSQHIFGNSRLWRFEVLRLREILNEGRPGAPTIRYRLRLLDEAKPILDTDVPLDWPSLSRVRPVYDGDRPVASLEVARSFAPILRNAAWIALGSVLLGLAVFATLRLLPLRALDRAFDRLAAAQHEIEAARRRAEAASRAKSEFLAAMSHELRTPLNAIIGFSDIARRELFGPIGNARYREYQEDIFASANHLLELINDVLDLSKAEAGKLRLAEDIVDVAAIVAECVSMVAAQASAGGVQLGDETPQDLPMLRVDRRATKQMLLNLLSNAIKFTGKGGSVTVTGAGIATGGVVLAVRDTGIGIAPEDIARALAPFEQVDSGHTRRYAGTGLGLALVQKLIDLHGGRLVLESAVGVGTTATLHFPAGRVCLAPAVPQSRSPGRPARSRDGMLSNF